MRVEGDDKAGLAGRLTQAWEMAGINLHGMVMSVVGGKFIGYVTFDTVPDANKAATILAELGTADPPAPVQDRQRGDQAVDDRALFSPPHPVSREASAERLAPQPRPRLTPRG